jgi:hypothetical protein
MYVVNCGLHDLLRFLQGMGKSVVEVLVDDNGVCYILLTDVLTPEAQRFINTRGLIRLEISTVQYDTLRGNTSMNLRNAIQNGNMQRGYDTPDDIWNMLCRRAGIINEPLIVTLSLFARHIAGYVLSAGMKLTCAQL